MNLPLLAWRYLWTRPLVTFLTVAGVALGVALICATLSLRRETEKAFMAEAGLFDMVVGAKGSPLQLVLSSVYHLDIPTGNIAHDEYVEVARDGRVRRAFPVGLGDNYQGHRIVGTTAEFLSLERRDRETGGWSPMLALAEGRPFQADFEAVIGSDTARRTGLAPGDAFFGTHGLVAIRGAELHDDFPYEVVGVLAETGTSIDRAIYTTLESVWLVHEADEELHQRLYGGLARGEQADEGEEEEEDWVPWLDVPAPATRGEREVTAVLVQLNVPGLRLWMADEINRGTGAMAAIPLNEILRLWQRILAPVERALLALAWLVVVVASLGVAATLVQSAERHRRDWAILRALGARRWEIFTLLLLEAVILTLVGTAAGWLLGRGGVAVAGHLMREQAGLSLSPWSFDAVEFLALGTVFAVGIAAGLLPAILAYRRRPAEDL